MRVEEAIKQCNELINSDIVETIFCDKCEHDCTNECVEEGCLYGKAIETVLKELENEEKNKQFELKYINNLESEIKRLERENINTIKMNIELNNSVYEVDTNIEKELKEGKLYYLSDSYTEPTKLKFMGYTIAPSVDNKILVSASCFNLNKNDIELYNPSSLYKTKNQATDKYLKEGK